MAAIAVLAVAFAVFAAIPFEESDAATPQGAVSVSEKYSNTLNNSTIGNVLWVESDDGTYTIAGYANKISANNCGESVVSAYNATWPSDAPKRGYAIVFSIFSDATSGLNYVHFMSQGKVKTAQANDSYQISSTETGKGLTVLWYLPESAIAGQKITGTFTYTIDSSLANPSELTNPKTINYSVELDFRTSGMTCRSSIPFVDFQDDPGTIVLGFYDGSRALAGMGS